MGTCILSCFGCVSGVQHEGYASQACVSSNLQTDSALAGLVSFSYIDLTARYDKSTSPTLVLSWGPLGTGSLLPAGAPCGATVLYINATAKVLFGIVPSEPLGATSNVAAADQGFLDHMDPILLEELRDHLKLASSSKGIPAPVYLGARRCIMSLTSRGTVSSREAAYEDQHHVIIEPMMFTVGAAQAYGQRRRLPKASATTGARGVERLVPGYGAWPALVVTCQPTTQKPAQHALMGAAALRTGPINTRIGQLNDSRTSTTAKTLSVYYGLEVKTNMESPSISPKGLADGCRPPQPRAAGARSGWSDLGLASAPNPGAGEGRLGAAVKLGLLQQTGSIGAEAYQLRQAMVLLGLAPMVTAVSCSNGEVLFQNQASIKYFGPRSSPSEGQQGAPGGPDAASALNTSPVSPVTIAAAPGSAAGGEDFLAELFAREPTKLERLFADVCTGGRIWKGLVQVPASCCAPADCSVLVTPDLLACRTVGSVPGPTGLMAASYIATGASLPTAADVLVHPPPQLQEPPREEQLQHVQLPEGQPQQQQEAQQQPLTPPPSFELPSAAGFPTEECSLRPISRSQVLVPLPSFTTIAFTGGGAFGKDLSHENACSDGGSLNIALTGALVSEGNHAADGGRFRRTRSVNVDDDPLATSTWGMMLDIEQAPQPDSNLLGTTPRSVPRSSASFFRRNILTAMHTTPVAGLAVAASTAAAAVGLDGELDARPAGPASVRLGSSTAVPLVAPRAPSATSFYRGHPQQAGRTLQAGRGHDGLVGTFSVGSSRGPSRGVGPRIGTSVGILTGVTLQEEPCMEVEHGGEEGGLAGRLPSETPFGNPSYVLPHRGSQQPSAAATAAAPTALHGLHARGALRRWASRGEVGMLGSAGPGMSSASISRVVAFASSLKSTPNDVQQALQLAVNGGATGYGGGCGGGESSGGTFDMHRSVATGSTCTISAVKLAPVADTGGGLASVIAANVIASAAHGILPRAPCNAAWKDSAPPRQLAGPASELSSALTAAASDGGGGGGGYGGGGVGGGDSEGRPGSWRLYSEGSSGSKAALLPGCPRKFLRSWCLSRTSRKGARTIPEAVEGGRSARSKTSPIQELEMEPSGCGDSTNDSYRSDAGSGSPAMRQRQPSTSRFCFNGQGRLATWLAARASTATAGSSGYGGDAPFGVDSGCVAPPVPMVTLAGGIEESMPALPPREQEQMQQQRPQSQQRFLGSSSMARSYYWHEVSATRQTDPVTGQYVIVLTQADVTAKVEAERHLALVGEAEHRLLEQIFPRHVLATLTMEGGPLDDAEEGKSPRNGPSPRTIGRDVNRLATYHSEVTLLFADIQGFTPMCKVLEPRVVMAFLNELFTSFDRKLDDFGVYKVETIGDCYFVAGGLIQEDEEGMPAVRARASHADPLHAVRVFSFAKAMLEAASQMNLPTTGQPVRLRIGIHSGPVVSGVVGERMPRFCLFGDTVNTASRMESTGVPGCIHASEAACQLIQNERWVPTGGIEVKGKGHMKTCLWAPINDKDAQVVLARHAPSAAASAARQPGQRPQPEAPRPCMDPAALAVAASAHASRGGRRASAKGLLCPLSGSPTACIGSVGSASGVGRSSVTVVSGCDDGAVALHSAGGFAQVWPTYGSGIPSKFASEGGIGAPGHSTDVESRSNSTSKVAKLLLAGG